MNLFALAAASLVAFSTSAIAADAVDSAPSGYDWSGGYVGAYIGYFAGDGTRSSIDLGSNGFSPDGIVGGGLAGLNWQSGDLVLGAEGDIGLSGISDDFSTQGNGFEFDSDFLVTLRVRAGFAVDNVLIYGTGGFAGLDAHLNDVGFGEDSKFMAGWTVGAGLEWAATDSMSIRAEGLYMDFGSDDFAAGSFDDKVDVDGFLLRTSAVWNF